MEEEAEAVSHSPQDCGGHDNSDSGEESKHEQLQNDKRLPLVVLCLSHTDAEAITQLMEIEKSNLSDDVLSMRF